MKTSFSILSLALLGVAQVAGQSCSLCPGGASSIADIRAQLIKDGPTCGEIEDAVAAMGVDDSTCTAAKENANDEFDYSKFCCDDVRISNIECTLCNGRAFDVNRILPADTNPQGLTCGEVKAMADVAIGKDSVTCSSILAASAGCCDASCSVCPLGSTLGDGSRVMPGQDTLTCEEYNLDLQSSNSTSECNSKKAPYNDFDIASYCGCSGESAPAVCDYQTNCAEGIADRSAVVDKSTLTCGNFERVADFIKSSGVCSNWKACCRSPETVAPASGALDTRAGKIAAFFTLGALFLASL